MDKGNENKSSSTLEEGIDIRPENKSSTFTLNGDCMKYLIFVMSFYIVCCAGCSSNKNVDHNVKPVEDLKPIDYSNKVRLDEDVFLRYTIETTLPYPSQYWRSKPGIFEAEVIVDEKGNVANINVLQSPDIFRDETVEALKKWKFTPFITDDGAISYMESTITLFVPIYKARAVEFLFRTQTIETVMPTYPEKSKENKTSGVIITEVITNQHGNVIQLNVLQSPDEYIRDATIAALKQWKFMPLIIEGRKYFRDGKITFLYTLDDGNAEVGLAPLLSADYGVPRPDWAQ